jgi:hypothetical protein
MPVVVPPGFVPWVATYRSPTVCSSITYSLAAIEHKALSKSTVTLSFVRSKVLDKDLRRGLRRRQRGMNNLLRRTGLSSLEVVPDKPYPCLCEKRAVTRLSSRCNRSRR